jgi:hypothetical protein
LKEEEQSFIDKTTREYESRKLQRKYRVLEEVRRGKLEKLKCIVEVAAWQK